MLLAIAVLVGYVPTYSFLPADEAPISLAGTPQEAITDPACDSTNSPGCRSTEWTDAPLDAGIFDRGDSVVFAVSNRSELLTLLFWGSAGALIVLTALGAWIAWIVAGRMLRPLAEVNQAAVLVAEGRLDHRINWSGPRDELNEIAHTFDLMLGSLERSFAAQQRFAQNASHELRTPLATTRALIDTALDGDADERELLGQLRALNERSITTVAALLDLAEIDAGSGPGESTFVPVRIDRMIEDLWQEQADAAAQRDLRVTIDLEEVVADGDPQMLRHLFRNLFQNAVQHNHEGGDVRLTLKATAEGSALCEILSGGEELTEQTVTSLTEPFVRGAGRTAGRERRGHGLGLSIAQAIAERHGATLTLQARSGGGLCAQVAFPCSEAPRPRAHD